MLIKGIFIDDELIDEVFEFLDEMTDGGHDPAHVVLGMLAVVQMIQDSSCNSHLMH